MTKIVNCVKRLHGGTKPSTAAFRFIRRVRIRSLHIPQLHLARPQGARSLLPIRGVRACRCDWALPHRFL
jgi:hypothetical protein